MLISPQIGLMALAYLPNSAYEMRKVTNAFQSISLASHIIALSDSPVNNNIPFVFVPISKEVQKILSKEFQISVFEKGLISDFEEGPV